MPEAAYDVYEHLLFIDSSGKLIPYLAQSYTVSDDGQTVTFKIPGGKKYHNGDPLNALTLKDLFDHWTSPNSDFSETYYKSVKQVAAPDEQTLIFTLDQPDSDAYWGTAYSYSPIIDVKAYKTNPEEFGKSVVVGSGPFKFDRWEGDSMTVVRNPDYSGAPASIVQNQGAPYLDKITYTFIPDQATRSVNLESGTFDIVWNPAPQDVARLEQNPKLQVIKKPAISILYMGFNFKKQDTLGDKAVREAIYRSIDRNAIVQKILFGQAKPAFSPVVPQDPGYWQGAETVYPYDVAKAKAILDQAGWTDSGGVRAKGGNQLALDLIILATSDQKTLAEVIQQQLAQIGVKVNIEALDKGTHQQRQLDGAYDLNFFKYLYDSSIEVLKILYHSQTMPPKGANWAFYSNPKADAAFDGFRRTTDPEKRKQAIVDMQQVLLGDVAMVPIYNPLNIWALQKWVQGFAPAEQTIYPLHNDVWVTADSPRAT